MVAQFGLSALGQPPAEGFNLLAWVMPFLALALGLWVVQRVARSWRAHVPAPVADAALVERYRSAVKREIDQLED